MKELKLIAKVENLQTVLEFIDNELENAGCPMKVQMQIDVAVEELFVNVANYAYAPATGEVTVRIDVESMPKKAVISPGGHSFPAVIQVDVFRIA